PTSSPRTTPGPKRWRSASPAPSPTTCSASPSTGRAVPPAGSSTCPSSGRKGPRRQASPVPRSPTRSPNCRWPPTSSTRPLAVGTTGCSRRPVGV
ncbi:uncharacterized protein METZ01_LOCUS22842, partial [marine metagenome]